MANTDTVELLRECDAGSKMAVSAIDEVLDRTHGQPVKDILQHSKQEHTKLGNEMHALLLQYSSDDKEPNPMAKGMSWLKTNWKMNMADSDATVADLMTDGCNMGVKSLYRYMNQYNDAGEEAKDICKRLIAVEEQLRTGMRDYL